MTAPTDVSLHVWGDGPPRVVGLHGWNGTHATFEPLLPHVPVETAGLAAVDLPGYGDSPRPVAWELDAVAASVAERLRTVQADTLDLVGSCSGGIVGLELARQLPAVVDRLVMLEPFAFIPWYLQLFLIPGLGRLAYWSGFGNPVGRGIAEWVLDDEGSDTDMMASFADRSIDVPYRYLEMFDDLDSPDAYADLPADLVLAFGERTFGAVRRSVDLWTTARPDASVVEIECAGHLLLEDAPGAVADLLRID